MSRWGWDHRGCPKLTEMARLLYSCIDQSPDVDHVDKSVTLGVVVPHCSKGSPWRLTLKAVC